VDNWNASPVMAGVTISASGAVSGDNVGVYDYLSSPVMTHVRIDVYGVTTGANRGIYNINSSLTIDNCVLSATGRATNYGMYNYGSTGGPYYVEINNCRVTGAGNTISNDAEFTVRVGASQLVGGAVTGGGLVTCYGAYDEDYTSPGYNICP
jgi:hypothetical protein